LVGLFDASPRDRPLLSPRSCSSSTRHRKSGTSGCHGTTRRISTYLCLPWLTRVAGRSERLERHHARLDSGKVQRTSSHCLATRRGAVPSQGIRVVERNGP
jgi:hypothetical protein